MRSFQWRLGAALPRAGCVPARGRPGAAGRNGRECITRGPWDHSCPPARSMRAGFAWGLEHLAVQRVQGLGGQGGFPTAQKRGVDIVDFQRPGLGAGQGDGHPGPGPQEQPGNRPPKRGPPAGRTWWHRPTAPARSLFPGRHPGGHDQGDAGQPVGVVGIDDAG